MQDQHKDVKQSYKSVMDTYKSVMDCTFEREEQKKSKKKQTSKSWAVKPITTHKRALLEQELKKSDEKADRVSIWNNWIKIHIEVSKKDIQNIVQDKQTKKGSRSLKYIWPVIPRSLEVGDFVGFFSLTDQMITAIGQIHAVYESKHQTYDIHWICAKDSKLILTNTKTMKEEGKMLVPVKWIKVPNDTSFIQDQLNLSSPIIL